MSKVWHTNKFGNTLKCILVAKYGDRIRERTALNDWIIEAELERGLRDKIIKLDEILEEVGEND